MTENVSFIIPLIVSSIHEWQNALPVSDKILMFDINNTLYCSSRGFDDILIEKINNYITKLGVQKKNHNLCEKYTKEYGLALLGIMKDFPETEPEDFYKHVEGSIDVSKYIGQDDELIKKLEALEGYKMYCFTNAHCSHALDVLNAMGITKFLSGIFHCNYDKKHPIIPKPDVRVYELISGLFPESEIYFYDDSVVNVKAGNEIGWKSELITPDYCIKKALQKFLTNETLDNGEKKRQEDAMSLELGAESKPTNVSAAD